MRSTAVQLQHPSHEDCNRLHSLYHMHTGSHGVQAKEKRKEREREVAKAQMAAALNHGISWGMGEDAREDDEEGEDRGAPSVDWRAYAQTHSLTDHQQKLADKLRRNENRIRNLTTEAERIRVRLCILASLGIQVFRF